MDTEIKRRPAYVWDRAAGARVGVCPQCLAAGRFEATEEPENPAHPRYGEADLHGAVRFTGILCWPCFLTRVSGDVRKTTRPTAASFGGRLRELRAEREWYQDDLAERAGMTQQTISRYERDLVAPTFDAAIRLADALEVSLDDLAGRKHAAS